MTHPAQSPRTERWLDDIGARWTFNPDLNLATIDQAASLANQVRHNPLHQETVDRYAADMREGDVFPAVIIDGATRALLGGNHRHAAHVAANHTTAPAYVVTADPATLLRIAVEDNRNHGLPTTEAERTDHAFALIAAGHPQAEAARITGIAAPHLSVIIGCRRAAERLADDPSAERFAKLPRSVRYSLSQIDDHDALCAAVDLTLAAGLPLAHVRPMVDSVKASDSAEALRLIGQLEEDYTDRIRDRAGHIRKAGKSQRGQLDNALAVIVALDPQAVVDACPNDDVKAVLAQRIMNAAGVLMPTHTLLTS